MIRKQTTIQVLHICVWSPLELGGKPCCWRDRHCLSKCALADVVQSLLVSLLSPASYLGLGFCIYVLWFQGPNAAQIHPVSLLGSALCLGFRVLYLSFMVSRAKSWIVQIHPVSLLGSALYLGFRGLMYVSWFVGSKPM